MTQPAHTNRPVDEVRIGRVKATIWRNETEDGKARFNTVFSRLYKDGEMWQSTPSFGRNDLLLVVKVAEPRAHPRVRVLGEGQQRRGQRRSRIAAPGRAAERVLPLRRFALYGGLTRHALQPHGCGAAARSQFFRLSCEGDDRRVGTVARLA